MILVGGCVILVDRFHPEDLVGQRARLARDDRALPQA
jgi:hypothetical protein